MCLVNWSEIILTSRYSSMQRAINVTKPLARVYMYIYIYIFVGYRNLKKFLWSKDKQIYKNSIPWNAEIVESNMRKLLFITIYISEKLSYH